MYTSESMIININDILYFSLLLSQFSQALISFLKDVQQQLSPVLVKSKTLVISVYAENGTSSSRSSNRHPCPPSLQIKTPSLIGQYCRKRDSCWLEYGVTVGLYYNMAAQRVEYSILLFWSGRVTFKHFCSNFLSPKYPSLLKLPLLFKI